MTRNCGFQSEHTSKIYRVRSQVSQDLTHARKERAKKFGQCPKENIFLQEVVPNRIYTCRLDPFQGKGSKKVGEGIANGFYLKLDHLRFVVDGHCNGDKSGT